jgi:hypothetical protein
MRPIHDLPPLEFEQDEPIAVLDPREATLAYRALMRYKKRATVSYDSRELESRLFLASSGVPGIPTDATVTGEELTLLTDVVREHRDVTIGGRGLSGVLGRVISVVSGDDRTARRMLEVAEPLVQRVAANSTDSEGV